MRRNSRKKTSLLIEYISLRYTSEAKTPSEMKVAPPHKPLTLLSLLSLLFLLTLLSLRRHVPLYQLCSFFNIVKRRGGALSKKIQIS